MAVLLSFYSFPHHLVRSEGLTSILKFEEESIRTVEGNRQGDDEAQRRDSFFFIQNSILPSFALFTSQPSRITP
jgi:hypothetical protein